MASTTPEDIFSLVSARLYMADWYCFLHSIRKGAANFAAAKGFALRRLQGDEAQTPLPFPFAFRNEITASARNVPRLRKSQQCRITIRNKKISFRLLVAFTLRIAGLFPRNPVRPNPSKLDSSYQIFRVHALVFHGTALQQMVERPS